MTNLNLQTTTPMNDYLSQDPVHILDVLHMSEKLEAEFNLINCYDCFSSSLLLKHYPNYLEVNTFILYDTRPVSMLDLLEYICLSTYKVILVVNNFSILHLSINTSLKLDELRRCNKLEIHSLKEDIHLTRDSSVEDVAIWLKSIAKCKKAKLSA